MCPTPLTTDTTSGRSPSATEHHHHHHHRLPAQRSLRGAGLPRQGGLAVISLANVKSSPIRPFFFFFSSSTSFFFFYFCRTHSHLELGGLSPPPPTATSSRSLFPSS